MRPEILDWLHSEGLWPVASPEERRFLTGVDLKEKDSVNFSWRSEAVYVLGWALGLEAELSPPVEQSQAADILDQMPAPGESTTLFLDNAVLRPLKEIFTAAKALFDAHASCRAAVLKQCPERHGYDIEIVQERHYAINWLICYEGADWDEVATDT